MLRYALAVEWTNCMRRIWKGVEYYRRDWDALCHLLVCYMTDGFYDRLLPDFSNFLVECYIIPSTCSATFSCFKVSQLEIWSVFLLNNRVNETQSPKVKDSTQLKTRNG